MPERPLPGIERNQVKGGLIFIRPSISACNEILQHELKVKKSYENILWSSSVKIMKSGESIGAISVVLSAKRHPKSQ
jgi:hypothetical protein